MLDKNVFYHGTIRKAIVAFGTLFSDVYIDRKQGDSVNGDTIQRLQVPIAYAPKEKWLVRLEQDPSLENHVYTTLPRMSFEITGYNYDASRKVGKMQKIICNDGTSSSTVLSPVPYTVDVSLYILTKTQEDALQIVEQILPTFSPEYTLSVNVIPEMNLIQDIPVTLNGVTVQDDYDGDFQTRRFVTHTLTFTLKLNIFGPVRQSKPIYDASVNLSTNPSAPPVPSTDTYNVIGDPATYTTTSESWINNL